MTGKDATKADVMLLSIIAGVPMKARHPPPQHAPPLRVTLLQGVAVSNTCARARACVRVRARACVRASASASVRVRVRAAPCRRACGQACPS